MFYKEYLKSLSTLMIILVAGRDETEHLSVLNQVLQRLEQSGLRLKKKKSNFMVPLVTYLGY